MKKYLVLLLFGYVCWAQSPIYPLNKSGNAQNGAYYKDLNNQLDAFEGTWIYTSGNTSLTITLQKKFMAHIDISDLNYYTDLIIGEYKYVKEGVTKINTLSQLESNISVYQHHLIGNYVRNSLPNRLSGYLTEPNFGVVGLENAFYFERIDTGGIKKLKLIFKMTSAPAAVNGVSPQTTYTLPYGEYILTKQP